MPRNITIQINERGSVFMTETATVFIPTELFTVIAEFGALGDELVSFSDKLTHNGGDLNDAGYDKLIARERKAFAKAFTKAVGAARNHARANAAEFAALDAVPDGDSGWRREVRDHYREIGHSRGITRALTVASAEELDALWQGIDFLNWPGDLALQVRDRRRLLSILRTKAYGYQAQPSATKIVAIGPDDAMNRKAAEMILKRMDRDASLVETAELVLQKFVVLIATLSRTTVDEVFKELTAD